MLKITQASLGKLLIGMALFLSFALTFNGGIGETFVNYSFFTSALLILCLGVCKLIGAARKLIFTLGGLSIVFYLPLIWQRFNFRYGLDSGGLYFDLVILAIVALSTLYTPSKAEQ